MIYTKQKGTGIIEIQFYKDGELLISVTNDYTASNGNDFLFSKEEVEELKKYFSNLP